MDRQDGREPPRRSRGRDASSAAGARAGLLQHLAKSVVEFADRVGQQPEPMRLPPPSPAAISRMEETLGWLRWLEVEDAKLVWARADRTPWKAICWQFGIARATAQSTMAVWVERDRVAAEWSTSASEAVAKFCGRTCEARELLNKLLRHADKPPRLTISPNTPK